MKFDLFYTPSNILTVGTYKGTPEVWKISTAASAYCQVHQLPIAKQRQLAEWLKQLPKEERLKCLLCPATNEYIWTDDWETHWKRGEMFAPLPYLFKSFEDLLAFSHNPTHRGQILLSKDAMCMRGSLVMRYSDPSKFHRALVSGNLKHWGVKMFEENCAEARAFCKSEEGRTPLVQMKATFLVREGKYLDEGAYRINFGTVDCLDPWVIDPTGKSFIMNWQLTPIDIKRKRVELTGRR